MASTFRTSIGHLSSPSSLDWNNLVEGIILDGVYNGGQVIPGNGLQVIIEPFIGRIGQFTVRMEGDWYTLALPTTGTYSVVVEVVRNNIQKDETNILVVTPGNITESMLELARVVIPTGAVIITDEMISTFTVITRTLDSDTFFNRIKAGSGTFKDDAVVQHDIGHLQYGVIINADDATANVGNITYEKEKNSVTVINSGPSRTTFTWFIVVYDTFQFSASGTVYGQIVVSDTPKLITHNLNNPNYYPTVIPLENPADEWWIENKTDDTFEIVGPDSNPFRAMWAAIPTQSTHINGVANWFVQYETTNVLCFADNVPIPLNDTYFLINAGGNTTAYYVWYNVGGAGTDPVLPGLTGIEVPLTSLASAAAVAQATEAVFNTTALSSTPLQNENYITVPSPIVPNDSKPTQLVNTDVLVAQVSVVNNTNPALNAFVAINNGLVIWEPSGTNSGNGPEIGDDVDISYYRTELTLIRSGSLLTISATGQGDAADTTDGLVPTGFSITKVQDGTGEIIHDLGSTNYRIFYTKLEASGDSRPTFTKEANRVVINNTNTLASGQFQYMIIPDAVALTGQVNALQLAQHMLNRDDYIPLFTPITPDLLSVGMGKNTVFINSGSSSEVTNITTIDDVGGSLAGKHFLINSGKDIRKYFVWYNVDGNTEITEVSCVGFPATLDGIYFTLNAGADINQYYVWYNTGASVDPAPIGLIPIVVLVNATDTAQQVRDKTVVEIDALVDFSATQNATPEDNILTIETNLPGLTTDASPATAGLEGFTIQILKQGASNPLLPPSPGLLPLKVDIAVNETAENIALATEIELDLTSDFAAVVNNTNITVTATETGLTQDSVDVDTGFTIDKTIDGVSHPLSSAADYAIIPANNSFALGDWTRPSIAPRSPRIEFPGTVRNIDPQNSFVLRRLSSQDNFLSRSFMQLSLGSTPLPYAVTLQILRNGIQIGLMTIPAGVLTAITENFQPVPVAIGDMIEVKLVSQPPQGELVFSWYGMGDVELDAAMIDSDPIALNIQRVEIIPGVTDGWQTPATWKGLWFGGTNYLIGEGIRFTDGIRYQALTNNINSQPDLNPTDWQALPPYTLTVPTYIVNSNNLTLWVNDQRLYLKALDGAGVVDYVEISDLFAPGSPELSQSIDLLGFNNDLGLALTDRVEAETITNVYPVTVAIGPDPGITPAQSSNIVANTINIQTLFDDLITPPGLPLDIVGHTHTIPLTSITGLGFDNAGVGPDWTAAKDSTVIGGTPAQQNMIPILDNNGLLDFTIIPSIAISNTYVVADITEMLALDTGATSPPGPLGPGDLAVVSDTLDVNTDTPEITAVTMVADIANSLNGKYWIMSDSTNTYYIWYNTGTPSDPAPGGMVSIQVVINTNDSAANVALATDAAIASSVFEFDVTTKLNKVGLVYPSPIGQAGGVINATDVDAGVSFAFISEAKTYILSVLDTTVFANWVELFGAGFVTSVNGKVGNVVIDTQDLASFDIDVNTLIAASGYVIQREVVLAGVSQSVFPISGFVTTLPTNDNQITVWENGVKQIDDNQNVSTLGSYTVNPVSKDVEFIVARVGGESIEIQVFENVTATPLTDLNSISDVTLGGITLAANQVMVHVPTAIAAEKWQNQLLTLNFLNDVTETGPRAADDALLWDVGLGKYKNKVLPGLGNIPYDIAAFVTGVPASGDIVFSFVPTRTMSTLAAAGVHKAKPEIAPTVDATFDIQKNGVSIGGVTLLAVTGTGITSFTLPATTLTTADVLTVVAPSPADATMATVAISISAELP